MLICFHLLVSFGWSINIYTKKSTFAWNFSSSGHSHAVLFFTNKEQLVHEVFNTSTTCSSLLQYLTDTDCQAQSDTTYSRIFATFKYSFLTNKTRNQTQNCGMSTSFCFFKYLFMNFIPIDMACDTFFTTVPLSVSQSQYLRYTKIITMHSTTRK